MHDLGIFSLIPAGPASSGIISWLWLYDQLGDPCAIAGSICPLLVVAFGILNFHNFVLCLSIFPLNRFKLKKKRVLEFVVVLPQYLILNKNFKILYVLGFSQQEP